MGLTEVKTPRRNLSDYEVFVGEKEINEIRRLAELLRGKKILHINTTSFGGGVAEILSTSVPLMNDLGLDARWMVLTAPNEFFQVTKAFHNSLQGQKISLTDDMKKIYLEYNRLVAHSLFEESDFVIVHDPQPLAIVDFLREKRGKWIWRCHIDATTAYDEVWDFLNPYMQKYDALVFTMDEFIKDKATNLPPTYFIPPSIDPLHPKNVLLSHEEVDRIIASYSVDPSRPIITQVSRFDPWKDPLGVVDIYRALKKDFPALQLVFIASMAHDDPEGWVIYDRVMRRIGEDFDAHILTNFQNVGNVAVNAFQRGSDVGLQKSIREGFGLTVTETLWKETPVVGGNVGGIKLQITDGLNGFLVTTVEEAVERVRLLLQDRDKARAMGKKGREIVGKNFLCTRQLKDALNLFNNLMGSQS